MRRHAFRIVLCLVLGVVTTVGVAWSLAYWLEIDPLNFEFPTVYYESQTADPSIALVIARHRGFGAYRISVLRHSVSNRAKVVDDLDGLFPSSSSMAAMIDARLAEAGVETRRLRSEGDPREVVPLFLVEDQRGWPVHSLAVIWDRGLEYLPNPAPYTGPNKAPRREPGWGIALSPYEPDPPGQKRLQSLRALPLRPVWPGFLIDTAFYAVVWIAVLFGFGTVRRVVRRRRGRCPACGYDLQGVDHEVCPECGSVTQERPALCAGPTVPKGFYMGGPGPF